MKPIAYNYVGDLVFEDDQQNRFFGRSAKKISPESLATNVAQVLRFNPSQPETIWLCALAFATQPSNRILPINEFFKVCSAHLPAALRSQALDLFIVDCLHGFYRCHNHLFDSCSANENSFAELCERFKRLDLEKAIIKIQALKQVALPISVLTARAAARMRKTSGSTLLPPYFDPLDQTPEASFAPENASLPWSLELAGTLRKSITAIRAQPGHNAREEFQEETNTPNQTEALRILRESHDTQIGNTGRHPYTPITKSQPASSSVTTSLLQAHRSLRDNLIKETPLWDEHVAGLLGIPLSHLADRLSAEQIDACGIASLNFQHRKSFILADETGLGKGRTLAALAKAFLESGRKVTFITEKKHLFSDFWRDLVAVYDSTPPPTPFLLHPKGRILSANGEIVCKALSPSKYKEQLETKQADTPLVFSTYSQFNRDAKHSPKFLFAEEHIQDSLLILDESHNASGESQTRCNIAHFISKATKCVFSSATYAKHEQAFELYQSATPLTKNQMALLLSSFGGADPLAASNAIAHGLVKIGSMVRREHIPDEHADTVIIQPDAQAQESINNKRQKLHIALESLFILQEHIDHAKSRIGEETDSSWMKLGGLLSRVSRQFNLLSKIELTCVFTTELIKQGKKPVLAMESTFESFLRAQTGMNGASGANATPLIEFDDEYRYEDEPPPIKKMIAAEKLSFKSLFELLINTVAPEELLDRLKSPTAKKAKHDALLSTLDLPVWVASPIDILKLKLSESGYRVGEISGRATQIEFDNLTPESFCLTARSADERESIVRDFNSGTLDVLILTQAGASGISLHASQDFTDQRTRAFIELEICANPSQRMQFLGRVRRKGQVCSPEYYAISSGTPYEHRLIERAATKQQKLSGLTSATQTLAAGSLTTASKIMTPKGDRVALEWLNGNPEFARRLGINPKFTASTDNGETVAEKLLKRLPLLPAAEQDRAFAFISAAIGIDQVIPVSPNGEQHKPYLFSPVLARTHPLWGPNSALAGSVSPEAFEPVIHVQEWICTPPVGNIGEQVVEARAIEALNRQESAPMRYLGPAASSALKTANISPEMRMRVNNMQNAASHLSIGSKIRVSHPDTGRAIEGMVIGIQPPSNEEWILYPSQWTIEAIFPGLPFELAFSMASFFEDPCAYLAKAEFSPSRAWTGHQERPYQFTTIAGHCGYSRWYADQFNASVTAKFVDSTGNYQELSCFASRCTIEQAKSWKIPLIDPRLTLQLMQHDVHLTLDNSHLHDQPHTAQLAPTGGGWNLTLERALHDATVDYTLERRLGPRRYSIENGKNLITRFVSVRDIHAVVTMLHNRQCRFFAPSSRSKWHANALELLLTVAKPAKKKQRH